MRILPLVNFGTNKVSSFLDRSNSNNLAKINLGSDTVSFASKTEKAACYTPPQVKTLIHNFENLNRGLISFSESILQDSQSLYSDAQQQAQDIVDYSIDIYDKIKKIPYLSRFDGQKHVILSDNSDDNTVFYPYNDAVLYQKGFRETSCGARSYDKKIYFMNGMPTVYFENLTVQPNGDKKFSKKIEFQNGVPVVLIENGEVSSDNFRCDKRVDFINGLPVKCFLKQSKRENGKIDYQQSFFYKDDKLASYHKHDNEYSNKSGSRELFEQFVFADDKLSSFSQRAYLGDKYSTKSTRIIKYQDDMPVAYKEGTKTNSRLQQRPSKLLQFKNGIPYKVFVGSYFDIFQSMPVNCKYACKEGK